MDTEIILKSACLVNNKDLWDKIGIVATCFGAIATFLACCIALWQTKYNNKKKLKLKFYSLASPVSDYVSFDQYLISINIVNIGKRKVEIQEWAYYVRKQRYIFMTNGFILNKDNQLPKKLDIEESFDLYFNLKNFLESIKSAYNLGKIHKSSKIKFGIKDSSGKVYSIKSKERVSEYLKMLEQYNKL